VEKYFVDLSVDVINRVRLALGSCLRLRLVLRLGLALVCISVCILQIRHPLLHVRIMPVANLFHIF